MKNKAKNNLVRFLFFFALVSVMFGCGGTASGGKNRSEIYNETNFTDAFRKLSATELVREFEENEARADEFYGGRRVRIFGKVSSIIAAGKGVTLTFRISTDTSAPARCYFDEAGGEQLSEIKSSEEITVEGTVLGFSESQNSVVLENCRVP